MQLFSKNFLIAWNVPKRCLRVDRRSRDLRPLSRDRSVTFFQKISQLHVLLNGLKRTKTLVWQSADGRGTSDDCRVTHCSVTFFKIVSVILLRNVQTRMRWQSADGRVTSDQCRVTLQWLILKISPNCFKRPKNVVWQSADGRVTSEHLLAWPFSDWIVSNQMKDIAWNVQKRMFRQSADGRVTSDHCRVIPYQGNKFPFFKKCSRNCSWNESKSILELFDTISKLVIGRRDFQTTVEWKLQLVDFSMRETISCYKLRQRRINTLFDSTIRTVAWPPTPFCRMTVQWLLSGT